MAKELLGLFGEGAVLPVHVIEWLREKAAGR